MIAEFSILPVGKGTSMAEGVAKVIDMVDRSGLKYKVNPMGTCVEGDLGRVLDLIRRCHEAAMKDYGRVITHIRIDDRRDAQETMEDQIRAVEERLRRPIQK